MIHENIELTGSFTVSGSFVLPSHSSGSAVAETGSLYHDSVGGVLKVYTGTQWVTVGEQTASVAPVVLNTDIEYLLVAGGAGGGYSTAGGGGAGGLLSSSLASIQSGSTFTVTIGSGGSGGTSATLTGTDGSLSSIAGASISTINATVGGGGGNGAQNGADGSSGGGGGYSALGASGTFGQGNDGGDGRTGSGGAGSNDPFTAGGGGGASTVGGDATNIKSGDGGDGKQSNITGTATYYAGGGGGGADNLRRSNSDGAGGLGGGGNGGDNGSGTNNSPAVNGSNGTANTGGGGGGGQNAGNGGSGGSGVAIFAYDSGSFSGLGGIKTTRSDGYMVHTFNSSGTLSIAGAGEYPVANGSVFAPVVYTGNGGTQSITGVGFQPDLVWIKSRTQNLYHFLVDSVRGDGLANSLSSNTTDGESFATEVVVNSLDTNGFTLNADDGSGYYGWNMSNQNMVAWCWKAGGAAVSNTDGTITSQVSANQAAGFSIVKYTGQAAARTVGHGLSTTPELVLIKNLDDTRNWVVYHKDLSASSYIFLNLGNKEELDTRINGGQPRPFGPFTSTTFGVNIDNETGHTNNYIAYCFHSVDGYQKVGSYTGNGSSTGPIITTGFRPRFIMTKPSTVADNWTIWDNVRETGDDIDRILVPNTANSETADGFGRYDITLSSTGFQIKQTDGQINTLNQTYIYLAIA